MAEQQAQGAVLMVARDHEHGPLAQEIDTGSGISAVPYRVAEAQNAQGSLGSRVGQHGRESFQVAVHVGEHRVSHAGPQPEGRSSL